MSYALSDAFVELDSRFEPGLRKLFDAHGGQLPGPLWVIIANHNPKTGKDFDAPTPMPVQFESSEPITADTMVALVRRQVALCDAVACFVAYQNGDSVKIRLEMDHESHEWLVPVIGQKGGNHYLGKRLDYSHGQGQSARLINDIDPLGGVFIVTSKLSPKRTVIEA